MNNNTKPMDDINDLFIDACDAIDAIQHHPACTPEQYKALEDAYYAVIEVKAQHEPQAYLFNGGFVCGVGGCQKIVEESNNGR